MYRLFIAVAAGLLLIAAAHAKSNWQGAGWYQIVDYIELGNSRWKSIYNGPYGSEADCLKVLHPDYVDPGVEEGDPDTLKDFSCVQLNTRPAWDE